jgi:hypothetical protein
MNLTWLFGKTYNVWFLEKGGGASHMFHAKFDNCPQPGDEIVSFHVFRDRCQWKVVSLEHRQGNHSMVFVTYARPNPND